MGRSQRTKGARVEREVSKLLGGKRMVMSGGSHLGGGDISLPADSIFHDFLWEVKARKVVPEIVRKALQQAAVEGGPSRMPAAIIKADNYPPTVHFYLDDFVQWANALAELGSGQKLKSIVRDIRRQLDALEGAL